MPFTVVFVGVVTPSAASVELRLLDGRNAPVISPQLHAIPAGLGIAGQVFVVHLAGRYATSADLTARAADGTAIASQHLGITPIPTCPPVFAR
jgi:hypothetical protein